MTRSFSGVVLLLLICTPALAQQTTGTVTGRITDSQNAAIPGATVSVKNPATGFTRTETSDTEGIYSLNGIPPGNYQVTVGLQGFSTAVNDAVPVYVARATTVHFHLKIEGVSEIVNVSAAKSMVDLTSSSVAGVVDPDRVRRLPLNGRQVANLAATLPGVGLGFYIDPTKVSTYAPFVNGGAGRNVNYQIDGGDNNDDTVGGLLQQFPLEAIQEFNFITQRFGAEYGRSNGGVMNVVTKSGTNRYEGSMFEMFRDQRMNAISETEKLAGAAAGRDPVKGDYRRNQFGGSLGGPIAQNTVHFFVAIERTQQDTTQTMGTAVRALFPGVAASAPVEYRDTLGTAKVTVTPGGSQYLSIRYGHDRNSFPTTASATTTPDNWADSQSSFNSINLNHNWVLSSSRLNEFVFQYSDYSNQIAPRSAEPNVNFPNGVQSGTNIGAPQTTDQRKFQLRDDFSWHVARHGGLGHDFKAGVNIIKEPRLLITGNTAKGILQYSMLNNDLNGPVKEIILNDGDTRANIPNTQYGLYFQDNWRAGSRLTFNLGVRYDLVTGINFDQSLNPNFVRVQQAAQAGRFDSLPAPVAAVMNRFALSTQADRNNIQPRLGAVYDLGGQGKDVIRAGWGVYTDLGYTNSNVLVAALDASGTHFGKVFDAIAASGLRNPDGSFYRVGQPVSNVAAFNTAGSGVFPLLGFWVDPRLQQPYQIQSNAGWSHELTTNTVVSVEFVNSLGRNLNYKPRLNQLVAGSTPAQNIRRISSLLSSPLQSTNNSANRPALSVGRSQYNALIFGVRRRMTKGIDFSGSYTLSRSLGTIGNGSDELNVANIQDPNNPFDDPRQFGPNRNVDARHRMNLSAIFELPYGVNVAPFFVFRSGLPVYIIDGRDLNGDGDITEIAPRAFAIDSVDSATGKASLKDIGPCETVNCGRGAPESQLNLRVSRTFHIQKRLNIEVIGEVYNVFNAINPLSTATSSRVTIPSGAQAGQPDPALLQPTAFAGDFQRPEQRVGQVGFRFSF